MRQSKLFYTESGNINTIGLVLSYFLGGIIALVLGYVYSVLIIAIPFVYINVLLVIGFGLLLSLIVRTLVRVTKNRNKNSRLLLSIVLSLISIYSQWIDFIFYLFSGKSPSLLDHFSNIGAISHPGFLIDILIKLNRVGSWQIFGIPMTGFPLLIIWILEALIIIGIPLFTVYKTKPYPFSENLNKWYPKYTLSKDFATVVSAKKMLRNLQNDPIKAIEELKLGTASSCTKIHIFYLKEENEQYVSFENIFIEKNGQGKKTTEITINNFKINTQTAKVLLKNFRHKRERINVI